MKNTTKKCIRRFFSTTFFLAAFNRNYYNEIFEKSAFIVCMKKCILNAVIADKRLDDHGLESKSNDDAGSCTPCLIIVDSTVTVGNRIALTSNNRIELHSATNNTKKKTNGNLNYSTQTLEWLTPNWDSFCFVSFRFDFFWFCVYYLLFDT